MYLRSTWFVCFILLFLCTAIYSQKTLQLENTLLVEREVAIDLNVPWEITWGPDDHIWATERTGRIKRINPITGNTTIVLDYLNQVTNITESGMLGSCFHPDFDTNNKIFVAYDYGPNEYNLQKRLVTFEWNGTTLENEEILLDNIQAFMWHSGCRLIISKDEKLLMTLGDVSEEDLSQNMNSILGKILRLNLDGTVPDDNPVPGSLIYSYGHRNNQGLSYGPNDILYASEHGWRNSDELNIIEPTRNYGWPQVEGICNTNQEMNFCEQNNVMEPIYEWSPCVAVNDICYYDHDAIPEWKGKMLMAILGGFIETPSLAVIGFENDGRSVASVENYFEDYGRLRDVCVNPHTGSVYFATNGPFYPSFGPNRIIEYYNPDFQTSTQETLGSYEQFINISPNPINKSGTLNIQVSDSFINVVFDLYTMNGEKVKSFLVDSKEYELPLHALSPGSYFIKAQNENGTITQKVIIN